MGRKASSAGESGPVPRRVLERPRPELWGEDEAMTLMEAAALHWPDGPLTTRSLRTAVRDGLLPVAVVAGKMLTSRRALMEMTKCATRPKTARIDTSSRPAAARPAAAPSPSRELAEALERSAAERRPKRRS